ncbi:sodium:solute symporter family protein [Ruegeria sp. SCP11]|uniref:sodium:solute symporter family protein n=1 Tax=Ruegeria sp. SCP11 TaxID=3141378 RepID=UPI00333CA253
MDLGDLDREMTATTLGIGLLILYFGFLKVVASWAHRHSSGSIEDYFLASRSLGVLVLTGTLTATIVNGLAVTGTPALFYRGGLLYGQMFVVVTISCLLMWWLGPKICLDGRKSGNITQAEYLAQHYNSNLIHALSAGLGLLALLPFLAVQIAGVGKVVAVVTGGEISFHVGAGLCVLSVAAYVFFGGVRAVVMTDLLQGFIVLAFLVVSAFAFVYWAGGSAATLAEINRVMPEKLTFNETNTPAFLDNVLSWSFALFLLPHVFQRLFMTETPQRVQRTAVLSLALLLVGVVTTLAMAMAATATFYGNLQDPDHLIAAMYQRYWPLGGVFLALVLFALTMSTIDSMLLTASSIVTRDFWCLLFGQELSTTRGFALARWMALLLLGLASMIAFTGIGRSAIVPWFTISAAVSTLLLWPLIGVFWQRATSQGVIAAMVLGFFAICTLRFTNLGAGVPLGFASVGFLVGAASFFSVSLLTAGHSTRTY